MGTSCLYVFIYNGYHYQFYRKYDSYLEAMGRQLVRCIKGASDEKIQKWKNLLEKIKQKYYGKEYQSVFGTATFESITTTLSCPLYHGLDLKKEEDVKEEDYYVDWIYFINLDKKEFSIPLDIDYSVKYSFDAIPKNWVSQVIKELNEINGDSNEYDEENEEESDEEYGYESECSSELQSDEESDEEKEIEEDIECDVCGGPKDCRIHKSTWDLHVYGIQN